MTYLRLSGQSRMVMKSRIPAPAELEPYRKRDGSYSFPLCGDIVRRLLAAFPDLDIDEDLKSAFAVIADHQRRTLEVAGSTDADLPYTSLYPYQRVAVRWLNLVKRGILADEQGLGKTVMSVMSAKHANPKKAIIVCTNAKRRDWYDHVRKWIPDAPVQILSGEAGKRTKALEKWTGYIVCGYKTAHIHHKELKGAELIIVDEAHKMRNKETDQFDGVRRISKDAEYVFLVTASPTVNKVGDIWTLLHLCDPKRFSSYWGFVYRFCDVTNDGFGLKVGGIRESERENLERLLSPYLLMREGMLGLPEPNIRTVSYHMTGEQKRLYADMDSLDEAQYGENTVQALTDVAIITRLRQIALHPGLIFPKYSGPSKIDALLDIVREKEGKVVMFTQYARLADMAAEHLRANGIEAVSFTGRLSEQAQTEVLNYFRKGSAQVIVVTHGVGGEGLDLVEADRAVFIELAWHPAGNHHAMRRILRHGQKSSKVEIIFLHVENSIEDHIRDIVREKDKVTIEEIMRRRRNGN